MEVNPTRIDHGVPAREACVLRYVLEKWSRQKPDQIYAKFYRGPSLTYSEMEMLARQTAAGLARLGVKQ